MAVFEPNLTSKLLLKVALKHLDTDCKNIVELGCGGGWITNQIISQFGTEKREYRLSDISEEAIAEATKLLVPPLRTGDLMVGDGFSPWVGQKFDFVINDIAGIADEIAVASDWYNGVPFSAGSDGLMNTEKVLSELQLFLAPNGVFIAPIISLSNVSKYKKMLLQTFNEVVFESKTPWPLPDSLAAQSDLLQKIEKEQNISLEHKYGKVLAFTEVCICKSLKIG